MISINVEENIFTSLALWLPSWSAPIVPFTYLGLPVGIVRPKIQDLTPIAQEERRLCATSCFLSQGVRLQLITSAFTSLPADFHCSLHIPQGIIDQLNRIICQCLWRGNNDTPNKSLAPWGSISKTKMKDGSGIVNFAIKNEAFLLKYLHKF